MTPAETPAEQSADQPAVTADDVISLVNDRTMSPAEEADVISEYYDRISQQMAVHLGAPNDVNWCGFAKWSSKAVGESLRLDDRSTLWTKMRRAFHLPGGIAFVVMRVVFRFLLGGAYKRGLTVANRSIFLEMATFHISVLDNDPDMHWLKAQTSRPWGEHFRPLLSDGGQCHLENAARLLRRAKNTTDSYDKSTAILGASIELSAYEQRRVQPALELVLYRPVRFLTLVWWHWPVWFVMRDMWKRYEIYTRPHAEMPGFVQSLEHRWARMYTRALFLDLPTGPVNLGHDLQPPSGYNAPMLGALPQDIQALVDQFQPTDEARRDQCWVDYPYRMTYIVDYFRAYQQVPPLMGPPFPERPAHQSLWHPDRMKVYVRDPQDPTVGHLESISFEPAVETLPAATLTSKVTVC